MSGIDHPSNADPADLTAALVASTDSVKSANDVYEAAAQNPAFLGALKVAYSLAKSLAPVGAGLAGGPAAGLVVAAGMRLLDAADGPNL